MGDELLFSEVEENFHKQYPENNWFLWLVNDSKPECSASPFPFSPFPTSLFYPLFQQKEQLLETC